MDIGPKTRTRNGFQQLGTDLYGRPATGISLAPRIVVAHAGTHVGVEDLNTTNAITSLSTGETPVPTTTSSPFSYTVGN